MSRGLTVFVLLFGLLALYNPGLETLLGTVIVHGEVNYDLTDSETFTSWHAELDFDGHIKLIFVSLMHNHVGVALRNRDLKVYLL